jgi:isoaspartyl peptidase/L-asparaginase-like protein (Ntn-hydrolase superfamily)
VKTTLLATAATLSILTMMAPAVAAPAEETPEAEKRVEWAIAVHGGAGGSAAKLTPQERQAREAVLKQALAIGAEVLSRGGSSLDAVEKTIRHLEDSPLYNAGRGAVLNSAGEAELDASIMDGKTLACGGVAGVRTVKHPITAARRVMTETRHVLLGGAGADAFAERQGLVRVEPKYFITAEKRQQWRKAQQQQEKKEDASRDWSKGTVGCAALDKHGNLAAGTSTGGRNNKLVGRIGDSPIVGAGTYADNRTCAVSGTGIGEQYIRHAVAYDVSARMRYTGATLAEAVHAVMHQTLRKGDGGLIGVDHRGNIVLDFNTPGMARGAADSSGRFEVRIGK